MWHYGFNYINCNILSWVTVFASSHEFIINPISTTAVSPKYGIFDKIGEVFAQVLFGMALKYIKKGEPFNMLLKRNGILIICNCNLVGRFRINKGVLLN